ncbi:MAG: NYN domain-containing protein [Dehalococcoidia bacterium]|nr:NYN domain-containing protein [Dehalococcoidia bacterium]
MDSSVEDKQDSNSKVQNNIILDRKRSVEVNDSSNADSNTSKSKNTDNVKSTNEGQKKDITNNKSKKKTVRSVKNTTAVPKVKEKMVKEEKIRDEKFTSKKDVPFDLKGLIDQVNILKKSLDASVIKQKVGIFLDVPNLLYGVDDDVDGVIDMGLLLNLLNKDRELVRATAYSPIVDDSDEPLQEQRFVKPFVPYDYRIVTKPMKRFSDGSVKGNLDIELVVDMITMSDRLDVVVLVSGDADFLKAIQMVQSKGIKVEVASFPKSTSVELKAVADEYLDLSKLYNQVKA